MSGRVPDLRAQDVPQLLLAGRALAPRPSRLRGVPRRLGREWCRVGVLGRARRGGPRRASRRCSTAGRRGRRDDVGLAGCERDRLGAPVRARRPKPDRDQRVRVPHRRPDRARAGAPRAPRSCTCAPSPTARSRSSASPRRSTSARPSSAARRSRTAPGTATTSRRSPRSRMRTGRSCSRTATRRRRDRARRAHARRRLRHGRHGQVPARFRRARLPLGARRGARGADADPDRLVRRRGHLPDGHLRLLAARDRPPLRCGDAAGAEHLRRCRRARPGAGDGRPGDRGARGRAEHAADRGARGARRRTSSPLPTRPGAARSSASARPTRPPSSPRSPRSDITCSLRDTNLRVAAHFYNTDDDIDTLLAALSRRRHLLA